MMNLKMEVLPTFPARVEEGVAIDIQRANGIYTIAVDFSQLTPLSPDAFSEASNAWVMVWDEQAQTYGRTSMLNVINGMAHVDVTVTSAEVLVLNATPVTIVPAPGNGDALIFEGAVIHKEAGTAYAGIASGEDLAIRYTNGSGLEVGRCETTDFLDQTTDQTRYVRPFTAAAGAVSDITPVANAPLVLHMLVGEITTGDSDLRLRVYYRIVPMTP